MAALLPVIVITILTVRQESRMLTEAEKELDVLANLNIAQIAKDVYNLCRTTNELLQERLSKALGYGNEVIEEKGGLSFSGKDVIWNAVNQYTGNTEEVKLPGMLIGGKPVLKTVDMNQYLPVVDDVMQTFNLTCTIFQRMNEQGDMLRVATNVPNMQNERAIGTFIPQTNPDGTENPVIKTILEGEIYRGLAYVVDKWYLTVYEPIFNENGRVSGILYAGETLNSVKSLRDGVLRISVGKTGYVYVLGGKLHNKGRYIISKNGERDGENILDSKDEEGDFFIKDIVENAVKLKPGEVYFKEYKWKNPGEPAARGKIAAVTYFEPWDWVIGAGVYKDDYYETKEKLEEKFFILLERLIFFGAAILILSIVLAVILSNRITKPIKFINTLAKKIADGRLKEAKYQIGEKLSAARSSRRKEETTELMQSFAKMTDNLFSLIGQVQQSGIQVTTSATEISASARQLEATVAQQAASTKEVTASSREISESAGELVKAMQRSGGTVEDTVSTAESGREQLEELDTTMKSLTNATACISTRLSVINDKADKISGIVTTINKISDQTNLLSLNASIEAEKAGDYGKGFSVVAREISRLADQTAIATKDIEFMVKEMQGSVSSGVMEMDKFGKQVSSGAEKINGITANIESIINQVHLLIPEFNNIDGAIKSQSEGAAQINEAMHQLNEAAIQTKEALSEFRNVTLQLNEAVKGLQKEVSHFKISK